MIVTHPDFPSLKTVCHSLSKLRLKLANDQYNYIIKNPRNSKFLKEINLVSVPRYLLFDKIDKLINNNALGPYVKEASDEINKLLK